MDSQTPLGPHRSSQIPIKSTLEPLNPSKIPPNPLQDLQHSLGSPEPLWIPSPGIPKPFPRHPRSTLSDPAISPRCPHVPPSLPQVRELCLLFTRGVDYHWQHMALLALQEVGVRGPGHGGGGPQRGWRVTLFPKDLQLAQRLRGLEVGSI
uniref:Uncharacterized protein n=1 Tax=Catharus ustulatus TaxID=91951 RepID=A0A8C3U7C7_CATUS